MIFLIAASFLLDGIFFSFLDSNTLLCPLFSILTLVIIYPFFSEQRNYFLFCGIFGGFYDICYANTLFLNVFLFLGISFIIRKFSKHLVINVLNTYLLGMAVILVYRTLHALFFLLLGFTDWDFTIFLNSILSSIILNSLYLVSFYFIAKMIRKYKRKQKYKLLKVKKS